MSGEFEPTRSERETETTATDGSVEADTLIEEVSIDGMCGVY